MSTPSMPKDWLILQCPACGSPMKVRAGSMAGSQVSCPACHSPVTIPGAPDIPAAPAGNDSPEFRATLPMEPAPGTAASRRRPMEDFKQDDEFTPTWGSPNQPEQPAAPRPVAADDGFLNQLKSTEDQETSKRIRIRKRRKSGSPSASPKNELADWNSSTAARSEAEIQSDPWLRSVPIPEEVIQEKERDFVVSEHDEDGQTVRRVKRVRKRRIFSLAQLFFRRLSFGMRILTLTIVTAIGVMGMWYGIKVFRQKFKPVTFDEVVAEQRPDRVFLSSQDENGAVEELTAYLAAQGVEQKLAHVRLPNRVRPMMEAWYKNTPDAPATVGEVKGRAKVRAADNYFVIVEIDVTEPNPVNPANPRTRTRSFAVEEFEKEGSRSYKVDWETSVEWREMSFAEFKQTQPRKVVPFRLKIRGREYYNHLFTDESRWLSCELYYPYPDGQNEFLFYGYIDRTSKAFEDLAIYTEGSNNASLILGLRYPDNPVSRDQVIIESLIHPSWFYSEDVPPAGFAASSK